MEDFRPRTFSDFICQYLENIDLSEEEKLLCGIFNVKDIIYILFCVLQINNIGLKINSKEAITSGI